MDKKCPLVLVEWLDSRQPVASWQRLGEWKPSDVTKCVSVGFLIQKDKFQLVLAPNMGDVDDADNIQMSGVFHIPTKCVTRISQLSEK